MKKLTLLLTVLVVLLSACAPARVEEVVPVKVYYAGESDGVKTALDLAVQSGTVSLVSALAEAEAIVLNGHIPEGAAERVAQGAGLFLILGDGMTDESGWRTPARTWRRSWRRSRSSTTCTSSAWSGWSPPGGGTT